MRRFIADRFFYQRTGRLIVPIAIQSFATSISGIIDSMMAQSFDGVSAIGTALQVDGLMQGASFGIAAGINVYIVQAYGAKKLTEMRQYFMLSLLCVFLNALLWIGISLGFNTRFLSIFISDQSVIETAFEYLRYGCFSFIFTALIMSFVYAYQSVQKTHVPLMVSMITLVVKIGLNYVCMFMLGFGIAGAGMSMTLSQGFAFLLYLGISLYTKQPFLGKVKDIFTMPLHIVTTTIKGIAPLVVNETLFGVGNSMFVIAYGHFGKRVMDCYYIGDRVIQVFYTVVSAISSSATSLIGFELGKKNYDYAQKVVDYFFGLAFVLAFGVALGVIVFAPNIVAIYHLSNPADVNLAIAIIRALSIRVAFRFFNVVIFATLRAGGESKYLAFLDSVIMWTVGIAITFVLIYGFSINNIVFVIVLAQLEQFVRLVLGFKRIKKKKWLHHLVESPKQQTCI
ncbi:putative MATE family efflux protein [Breznakia blatticola]|uniref:Probable multidrug resistance protein NorM n=1 Tax=Breznakia blatticola TaxID=1754012 RepID=A0A4R7ZGG5_9FIRM|nr:MATE family efflux transporter [Breznakia blatticola]TDW16747.1 putative MATE family efflux protein [Breznakia blatticola]